MMLPDADYIREAENYGMPAARIYCPVCGYEDPETLYAVESWDGGDKKIIGCSECVEALDAADGMQYVERYEE